VKKFDNAKVGLTDVELAILTKLDTPQKIQKYVSEIPHNFEPHGDSCMSVREVLRTKRALCMEGALVAALALWIHGERPLILDLSAEDDDDHVITLYKRDGLWGAISKSNHPYVRFRDPVYRTIRELVMSYVHEYYNTNGQKSLRSYGAPLSLTTFRPTDWITGTDAWEIAEALCDVRHIQLMTKKQASNLRPIDPIEHKLFAIRSFEK
jgi:hypothetical protein